MKDNQHPILVEFLDDIKARLYSAHTLRSYEYDLNQYIAFCKKSDSKQEFYNLDRAIIQEYLQFISYSGLSAKTLARKLASIKSLYKFMLLHNYVDVNITDNIKTPKIKKELPQFLSLEQVKQILTLPVGNDEKAVRELLILELFYATGVRISELISIRFADIRLEEGIIYIIGKGNKERIVMIGSAALITLKKYITFLHDRNLAQYDSYLFPALKKTASGHISTRTVFNIVKKYMRKVSDDEKLSPHSLRHSFATHMLNNGADLMAIKDLLGHSSLSSTQVYTHLEQEKLKKIYKKAHPHGK